MAEPLKNVYDINYIDRLGRAIEKATPSFNHANFRHLVLSGKWENLELKQRISRICSAIHEELDVPFKEACEILKEVAPGFNGYAALFFPEFIERFGKHDWETSMKALEVLTRFSSAEFAIRTFILNDTKKTMKQMLIWSKHKNEHVRRLASEGCRPRLPWAQALNEFKKNPTLIIPILDHLKNDSSLYVRKSVANNLNDISKDDPKLALRLAKRWLKESPTEETTWIIKHGLRTLLKASDEEALKLFGLSNTSYFEVGTLNIETPLVNLGESLRFNFPVLLKKSGKLRIEYALYFKNKKGEYGRKVFKISEKDTHAGEYEVTKSHTLKNMTTRNFNEGVHFLEIILNGKVFSKRPFYLYLGRPSDYYIYMILTSKNTLYTGITTEPNRRFIEHSSNSKGAKYTKGFDPVSFVHIEKAHNRSEASKRESAIKKLSRKDKESLIGHNLLIFN